MAKSQEKIYQGITDRIVKTLESGIIPWKKSWNPGTQLPMNFITKKPYHGVNVWILLYSGFECRYWATFNQIKKLGGKVKKGEKAMPVVFWSFTSTLEENKNGELEEKIIPFLKEYSVFNLEQTENIDIPDNKEFVLDFNDIHTAKEIVDNMPQRPSINHIGQDRAFYNPKKDKIVMPKKEQFDSEENYYQVLFHELSHSTGHQDRLNRPEITNASTMFGDHCYSKEELVAEFSSSYLCGVAGIDNDEITKNSAAYIQGWSRKLRDNPKWLISACGKATKSANFILNIKEEKHDDK